jgi:hypothetical protein
MDDLDVGSMGIRRRLMDLDLGNGVRISEVGVGVGVGQT